MNNIDRDVYKSNGVRTTKILKTNKKLLCLNILLRSSYWIHGMGTVSLNTIAINYKNFA